MSEQVKIVDGKPVCFLYDEPLPSKVVVCSRCDGKGTSTAYLGAYTPEEMDEQGPEFFDDYMGGMYDRQCDVCNGLRVTAVILWDELTKEQEADLESDYIDDQISRNERLMGC